MRRITTLLLLIVLAPACQNRQGKALKYLGEGVRLVEEAEAKGTGDAQALWESAQAKFKAALIEDGNIAEAHYYLGLCNLRLGWMAVAEEEIKLALRLLYAKGTNAVDDQEFNELLVKAHNNLGEIYMQKAGITFYFLQRFNFSTYYYDEGMKQFQQALRLNPSDRATLRNIRYYQVQAANAMRWLRRQLVRRQRS